MLNYYLEGSPTHMDQADSSEQTGLIDNCLHPQSPKSDRLHWHRRDKRSSITSRRNHTYMIRLSIVSTPVRQNRFRNRYVEMRHTRPSQSAWHHNQSCQNILHVP